MQKWADLSPRARRTIAVVAVVDLSLRATALVDLVRRPASQVRGSKRLWAAAIALANTAGLVPVVYFVGGIDRSST